MNKYSVGDKFKDSNGDIFTIETAQAQPLDPLYTLSSFKGFNMILPEREITSALSSNMLKWYFMTMRTSMSNKITPKNF